MKKTFEKLMFRLMQENEKIILLTADNDFIDYEAFIKAYPNRCYDYGIAECNMIGSAAGFAKEGFIPVVYGVGAFLAYRAYEFIRCDICLHNLKVICVGFGAGMKINNFGPTHHSTEDISVLRSLPNLSLLSPASDNEVQPILEKSIEHAGPTYIRLGKAYETEIFDRIPEFEIGKSIIYRNGKDLTFFTTGNIISEVIIASDMLKEQGIDAEIINISSLKPIDNDTILKSSKKTGRIITVEEHQIEGGLGGIIAEVLTGNGSFIFDRIGLFNTFVTDYGRHKDLLELYGLDANNIFKRTINLLSLHN